MTFFKKKLIISLLLIILTATFSNAGDKSNKHFLWKVEKNGKQGYLLGSIHVGKQNLYPLDKIIEKSFEKSDFLAVELNAADPAIMQKIQQLSMTKGMFSDGKTLKDALDPDLFKELETLLTGYGIPIAQLQQFKPWMVSMSLIQISMMKKGYMANQGIDIHFLQAAKDKKEIVSLETAEFQIGIFANLNEKLQSLMLKDTLKEVNELDEFLDNVFKAWESGDTKSMENVMFKNVDKPEYKDFLKAIYTDRNINMAKKVEELLQKDKIPFVVVGSAHLVGKEGVPELLKKKGYKVEQL